MTEEDAASIYPRALKMARILRHDNADSEDFAQDAIVDMLARPDSRQNLRFRLLDCIRAEYGRAGSGVYKGRLNYDRSVGSQVKLNREALPRDAIASMESYRQSSRVQEGRQGLAEICRCLKKDERALVYLRYVWELTGVEIAECFGITPGRLIQKFIEINDKIEKYLVNKPRP